MFTAITFSRPDDNPPPVPAMVRTVPEYHLTWNRPLFKAPPLVVEPPIADVADFTASTTKVGRAER